MKGKMGKKRKGKKRKRKRKGFKNRKEEVVDKRNSLRALVLGYFLCIRKEINEGKKKKKKNQWLQCSSI